MCHLNRPLEELADIGAHEGAWHQAKVAERRVAAADVRRVGKDPAEAVILGQLLKGGARVCDRGKVAAGHPIAPAQAHLVPEVSEMREGLSRLTRLRRNYEQ